VLPSELSDITELIAFGKSISDRGIAGVLRL
jgi:hypothetical protein